MVRVGCKRCGRKLTAAASVVRGFGDRCWKLARLEAQYSARQLESARELVADRAIVASLRRPGFFTAVNSDGTGTYLVHRAACTCPAGRKSRPCYHRAAIGLLAA